MAFFEAIESKHARQVTNGPLLNADHRRFAQLNCISFAGRSCMLREIESFRKVVRENLPG